MSAETKTSSEKTTPPEPKKRGRKPSRGNTGKTRKVQKSEVKKTELTKKNPHTGKNFSRDEKIAALMHLRSNRYNLAKTAKHLGVSAVTIKRWKEQYQADMDLVIARATESEIALLADHLEDKYKVYHEKFIKAVHVVKMTTLNRIYEVIPNETRLNYLSETLKILHEITDGKSSFDSNEQAKANDFVQVIQQQVVNIEAKKEKQNLLSEDAAQQEPKQIQEAVEVTTDNYTESMKLIQKATNAQ